MAYFRKELDTQVAIFRTSGSSNLTGFRSNATVTPVRATGNVIEGFKFDESFWRSAAEENDITVVTNLWDPSLGDVPLQSGIGDGEDLELEEVTIERFNNKAVWRPVLNHGFYYDEEEERYLFSDDALTVYPAKGVVVVNNLDATISGGNYLDLQFTPKPGVPILARTFKWDSENFIFNVHEQANKKVEFTPTEEDLLTFVGGEVQWDNVSTAKKEFLLDYSQEPPRVIFNQEVSTLVGRYSIADTQDELEAMELVGILNGEDFQELNLMFSPVDRTQAVQVLVSGISGITTYTVVSGLSMGGSSEVVVDYDLGILKFGSADEGGLPEEDAVVYCAYYKTMAVEYEPAKSRDTVVHVPGDLNPIRHYKADGFVFVGQHPEEVESLILSAELPEISTNYFGPLYTGNDFANIIATVLDRHGNPVEGIEVFFEKVSGDNDVNFGSDETTTAISNGDGEAVTLLNGPRTISSLGGYTDVLNVGVSGTQLYVDDYFPPTSNDDLYLYQVQVTDNILGIPKANLLEFYEDYIDELEIDPSITAGPLVTWSLGDLGDYSWISGAYEDLIKWEILHREAHHQVTPITYEVGDLSTGKRNIVAVLDSAAVNPHTGTTPAFVPLQPIFYTITESGTYVDFDQTLPAITSSGVKSYQVIGPEKVTLRAYTFNPLNNRRIESNTIDVLIDIADSGKGLYTIDAINSVPSGLLGNAYFYDQKNVDLEDVNISSTGLLPVGWRIRSPGVTIASALDSVTFIDINPLDDEDIS